MQQFEVEIIENTPVVTDPNNDLGGQSQPIRRTFWADDAEDEAAALGAAWRKWDQEHPGRRPEPHEVTVTIKLIPAPR